MLIHKYNPEWPEVFEQLKTVYLKELGELVLAIEHVGSTSVPRLAAKAIIDIDMVMDDYDQFPKIMDKLSGLGYHHIGDLGIEHREAFKRKDVLAPYTQSNKTWMDHNLYVCPQYSRELMRHLSFRDYLRKNEVAREAYEKLKYQIAAEANQQKEQYVSIKEIKCRSFIEGILGNSTAN